MELLKIENKSGKVKLTDAVTPWSVEKLTEEIGQLFGASAFANGADFGTITNCAENAVDTLELEINSPGGSIFDGYNIYNEIKSLQERGVVVTATVTGMAASMASVICMACDEVRMVPHARMMIHEASNTVKGNADQLRAAADLLDGISTDIAVIYSNRTGMPVETIRGMMKVETWMTAAQAVENGFANSIFDIRANNPKPAAMSLLSALFPGNDQVAKLEAQIAENDQLRAELADAQAKITEVSGLSAIVAEKDAELTTITAEFIAAKESAAAITAELVTVKAELETAKGSVPAAVVEALASIGQDGPLAIEGTSVPVDHIAIMNSLPPNEKRSYWKSNAKAIRASFSI